MGAHGSIRLGRTGIEYRQNNPLLGKLPCVSGGCFRNGLRCGDFLWLCNERGWRGTKLIPSVPLLLKSNYGKCVISIKNGASFSQYCKYPFFIFGETCCKVIYETLFFFRAKHLIIRNLYHSPVKWRPQSAERCKYCASKSRQTNRTSHRSVQKNAETTWV